MDRFPAGPQSLRTPWGLPARDSTAARLDEIIRESFMEEVGFETGEGNGTPLQYSCLEDPMERGAW